MSDTTTASDGTPIEFVLVPKQELEMLQKVWKNSFTLQDAEIIIWVEDVISRRISKAMVDYQLSLSLWRFSWKENDAYLKREALGELLSSIGPIKKKVEAHKKAEADKKAKEDEDLKTAKEVLKK